MPLPSAWGEKRRTSQAATPLATAQVTTTKKNHISAPPCAHEISTFRSRSAGSSERRNTAPKSPAAPPAKSDKTARTKRPPSCPAVSTVTSGSRFMDPVQIGQSQVSSSFTAPQDHKVLRSGLLRRRRRDILVTQGDAFTPFVSEDHPTPIHNDACLFFSAIEQGQVHAQPGQPGQVSLKGSTGRQLDHRRAASHSGHGPLV